MSKANEEIKELQRVVNRLTLLEGALILFPQGAYLVTPARVVDPAPLLSALSQAAPLTEAECIDILQRTFSPQAPRRISPTWLATAQRDLRRLEEAPGLLTLAQENVKRFKGQVVDRAWLLRARQRLELLRGLALEALPSGPAQVLSSLHGEDAAQRVSALLEACVQRRSRSASKAARRVELLALRVEGAPLLREEHEYATLIEGLAAQARETLRLPGRARRKRLWRLIEALYSWPDPPKKREHPEINLPVSAALPAAIREIAARLIKAQPRVDHAARRAQLTRLLFGYAVRFPPQKNLRLDEAQLTLLQRREAPAQRALSELSLSLEQVIELVTLPYQAKSNNEQARVEQALRTMGAWVSEGLPVASLKEVAQQQLLGEMLEQDWSTKTAQSYCKWVLQLAPHYQQRGIKLALSPETFRPMQQAKNEELALLAQCLLAHHAADSTRAAREQIATLDATIALFKRLPQRLRDCLKQLEEAPPRLGQAQHPAFSAWLGDATQLDRYLHLRALLNEEQSLSRSLLEDFSREQRRAQERQHLRALGAPTPLQQKMLARLSQAEAPSDPARTRRRLAERADELLQRLYRARLDEIIAESLLRAFGLSLQKITPAWRDIFRFYMSTEDNRDWLGLLLRKATERPGDFFVPTLPANQRWLTQAAAHLDVSAWLAPRRQSVLLEGKPYTLQLEEDPIEVLRMGVPFSTCLSLESGENAAAAVLNAIDVNKRVIYLKDQRGSIIARQLIAISSQHRLLCYRVYCALEGSRLPLVQAHFAAFVAQLAAEARLSKANVGAPEQLHEGFWYDDGVLSEGASTEVAARTKEYCAMLQLETPPTSLDSLQEEADAWLFMREDRPEEAARALRYWDLAPYKLTVGAWLYQRLGHVECVRRSLAGEELFLHLTLHSASQRGLSALLLASREVIQRAEQSEALYKRLLCMKLSALDFFPIIKEARRLTAASTSMDDHGLEHGLAYELPPFVSALSLQQLLQICDEVQPLWDWVTAQEEDCVICMQTAEHQIIKRAPEVYLKDPAQRAVLACLQDKRRSLLSRKIALRIVALFPMPQRSPTTYTARSWFTRGTADAVGLRKTLKELARDPRFSRDPDLLAALLRQGGSAEDIEALPLATRPPFEALDNLILQLDWLGAWLRKSYPSPGCDPEDWRPELWELYFHRRFATPWRKALRREVEDNEPAAQRAAKLLCELGDTESIQRLQQSQEAKPSKQKKDSTQGFHWSWDAALMTADVSWQLDTAQRFEDYLPRWSSQRLVSTDAALAVAALDFLQRAPVATLLEDTSTSSPLHRAAEAIFYAEIPEWIQANALEWLIEQRREDLPEPIISAFRQRLNAHSPLLKAIAPGLLLTLWGYSSLQTTLLNAMSKLYRLCDVTRLWDALDEEAARQRLDCAALRGRWLAAVATGRLCDELNDLPSEERLREVMRAVLRYATPKEWLDFYGELRDALSVSWFFQELQALPAPPYREILAAIKDPNDISWDEKRLRFIWLQSLCQQRLA